MQGLIVNGEQLDKAGRREEQKVDNALWMWIQNVGTSTNHSGR